MTLNNSMHRSLDLIDMDIAFIYSFCSETISGNESEKHTFQYLLFLIVIENVYRVCYA